MEGWGMKKAFDEGTTNAGGRGAVPTIQAVLDAGAKLWSAKNMVNIIHWTAIGSAIVVSVGTTVVAPGNEKVAGYGIAVALISIAQVIHKFTDALDHRSTLTQAVEVTLPAIEAATTGNQHQQVALEKEINKS
jgi:hypothetical protein